ncbi:MAG: DNA (cytosine-5-)-methyltransferase [Candidatus Mcinerneyibacterium aminivorans]|uniref:Cytosine-specific methyltransferase n=1 Tax=Candidatus Mcinerneyibacterium aminivorans TaxID=2703815 RepID=A0A5D0MK35_9BACT|nr:MAG: DNA (cytosine-5-)-methyltransferase [Candidatus Mcinerneyibacterium aminivorans]
MNLDVGSLFAGVGGICLGFKKAGYNVVWANEFDKFAQKTYKANFPDVELNPKDIRKLSKKEIPQFEILTAGFPCQAFSIAGYQNGFDDERGNLFFEIKRIIEIMNSKPKILILENVKNLESHDNGNTFKVIKEVLKYLGYSIKYKILNTLEYANIPQNRERIFIIGFLNEDIANKFEFPEKIDLNKNIHDVINIEEKKPNKYYYKQNSKYFKMLKEKFDNKNTVYQIRRVYVRKNKSNVCPTLTANMGTGGHNVPIIKDKYGFRKLTPRETFLFQGFDKNFILPDEVSDTQLYKQAGNTVTVTIIKRIAKKIKKALKETDSKFIIDKKVKVK